jgi:hypothetical protein
MCDRFEYFDLLTKFDAFGAGRSWIISWISHDQKLNQIAKSDQISLSQSQSVSERFQFSQVLQVSGLGLVICGVRRVAMANALDEVMS